MSLSINNLSKFLKNSVYTNKCTIEREKRKENDWNLTFREKLVAYNELCQSVR